MQQNLSFFLFLEIRISGQSKSPPTSCRFYRNMSHTFKDGFSKKALIESQSESFLIGGAAGICLHFHSTVSFGTLLRPILLSIHSPTDCVRKAKDFPKSVTLSNSLIFFVGGAAGICLHFLPNGKKIMVLSPSSRGQATPHRGVAFKCSNLFALTLKKVPPQLGWNFFGGAAGI